MKDSYQKKKNENMLRIATLFSGIGAFEFALKRLNISHKTLFACDNGDINFNLDYEVELENIKKLKSTKDKEDYAYRIYKTNSKKHNFVRDSYLENYKCDYFFNDIKLLDGTDFNEEIDILVGGSPCQSFSQIGRQMGLNDTRGTLFYDYARIINEIKPKVFIYENVSNLIRHDKGKTWQVIQNVFNSLGYFLKWQLLDSRDYCIPQGRRRIFIVGFKEKEFSENFNFPKPKELKFSMQDFLLDNCKFGNFISIDGEIKIKKSKGKIEEKYYLSEKLKSYVLNPGTKNFYHENAKTDLQIARAILSTQGNSHRASVNNYVTTNGRLRALTEREALRLFGFTDDFKIPVSMAQSRKQSGNSIVVDVLMEIYKEIEKSGVFNEDC